MKESKQSEFRIFFAIVEGRREFGGRLCHFDAGAGIDARGDERNA
jgi:hypothetical protein